MKNKLWKLSTVGGVLALFVPALAALLAGCGPEATSISVPVELAATSAPAALSIDTPLPPPAETGQAGALIDDFEGSDLRWQSYPDEGTISFTCQPDRPGHAGAQAMRLTFEIGADEWPVCVTEIDPGRWGEAGGLSFFWRADQPGLALVVVLDMEDPTQTHPDSQGVTPFQVELQTPGQEWTPVTLTWDDFAKAAWVGEGGVSTLDPRRVVALSFGVSEKQSGSVWVDDLQLTGLVARPAPTLPPADTPVPLTAAGRPAGPSGAAWKPAGFGAAGNFIGIYFDPNQPGVVYALSDVAGVMRSEDYGDHWQVRSAGLGNYQVSSFAVDPFDSNTLYAGAGAVAESERAGIYVSHDAGLTWEHLESTFTNRITFRRFRTAHAIAPDPAHQGVILSGSRANGIWRSTDSGLSWSQVYAAPLVNTPPIYFTDALLNDGDDPTITPYPAPVSGVFFDLADPGLVYAGFDSAGVVRSTDGGLSWEPINNGLPDEAKVKYLAVGRGGVLYVAVGESGVYKSADGGDTWQPVNNGLQDLLPDHWPSSVVVHPDNPDIAYLTVVSFDYPNVWKTADGGVTWSPSWAEADVTVDPVNDPARNWEGGTYPNLTWQMALDPSNPERMIYVDLWSIFRSEDGGMHWKEIVAGAQNTCVNRVVVDTDHPAGEPDVWYATHWDAGLLASTDHGATWARLLPPRSADWNGIVEPLAGHYWGVAMARVGETKYYYVTSDPWNREYGSRVLRSTDSVNWTTVFNPPRPEGRWIGGFMLGLAVDPGQPSTLYVTQDGGQVFKSTDSGDTWSPMASQPEGNSFTYALAVDEANRVFAGTLLDGLWRSMDGGDSWQRVLTEQSTIFHALAVPGAIYASAGDGNLYRSTDGGDTWQRLTGFSSVDSDGVGEQGYAIAVDPNNPDHLFFSRRDTWHPADAGPGIVESTDGGVTWRPLNAGLGQLSVNALTVGPDGNLLAGTGCAGLWYLPVGAATSQVVEP